MVDGDTATNVSNQAERGGRIGILAVILKIAKIHDIQRGHVKILIDNKQALAYGTQPRHGDGPFKHLADDYDLKCWITKLEIELAQSHNILITYEHVYSHQDDPVKLMKIDPQLSYKEAIEKAKKPSVQAQVNMVCDKEATRGQEIFRDRQKENGILPDEVGAVLTIEGKQIFRKMKEAIYFAAHAPEMVEYLAKYEWGEGFGLIDWKSHKKAWESTPPGQRFSVSKRVFGWLPTNERLHSWVPPAHPHPNCPLCSNEIETNDHVFQCDNPISRGEQQICLERIRKWGKKKGMQPLMMSLFVRHINAWMRSKTLDIKGRLLPGNMMHNKLMQAITEQGKIGWGHALRGRLSVLWGDIQNMEDEKQGKKKRTGIMAIMIVQLWDAMQHLWKFRNGIQHGVTKEERRGRANERIHPKVKAAYRTRHHDVSLFSQRLFSVELKRRLEMDPVENERWLEIVETAKKNRWAREDAVLAAMRKITTYFLKIK